jgi:hypothetical protein
MYGEDENTANVSKPIDIDVSKKYEHGRHASPCNLEG